MSDTTQPQAGSVDKCDCQFPPPNEDADGTFGVSNSCPVHNDFPEAWEDE